MGDTEEQLGERSATPRRWPLAVAAILVVAGASAALKLTAMSREADEPDLSIMGMGVEGAVNKDDSAGRSVYVVEYDHGRSVLVSLMIANTGSRDIEIKGVELPLYGLLLFEGVQMDPPDHCCGGLSKGADAVEFQPFTLGSGETRSMYATARMARCTSYGGQSLTGFDAVMVRYRHRFFDRERPIALLSGVRVAQSGLAEGNGTRPGCPELAGTKSPQVTPIASEGADTGVGADLLFDLPTFDLTIASTGDEAWRSCRVEMGPPSDLKRWTADAGSLSRGVVQRLPPTAFRRSSAPDERWDPVTEPPATVGLRCTSGERSGYRRSRMDELPATWQDLFGPHVST